jgi:hypothetical protein
MVKLVEFTADQTQTDLGFSVVEDLCQHMKNDPMFYRKQYYPMMAYIQDKLKKGEVVDQRETLAPMIEKGCKHYCSKYDIPKSPEELLTKEDYTAIVEKLYGEEMELIRDGEY